MAARRWRVETPERVVFHFEVAGLATRLAAWAYDQAILTLLRAGLALGLGRLGALLAVMSMLLLEWAYFILWEGLAGGRTPGKRAMGLRAVAQDGGRLAGAPLWLRNLLRPVDMLPVPGAGVLAGGLSAWIDRAGRRLGDLAAGTLVAVDRPGLPVPPPAALPARVNTFQEDASLRRRIEARVTREERDLIHDLATRRDQLDPEARERLFARAAAYFTRRCGLPGALSFLSDEQVVLNLCLALAPRAGREWP